MALSINIDNAASNKLAEALTVFLADNFLLAVQTQGFHWNVEGPHFAALHALFEAQYNALFEANDTIAERIRALGEKAPGTMEALLRHSSLQESSAPLGATAMIETLLISHEQLIISSKALIAMAEKQEDEVTGDLLTSQLGYYEKTAWMLRSLLAK